MAFETRYEVSTQVDSSAPADRLPEMCGSATLAIEVSRTSMKVANVTVSAITQGLMLPSGVRSFDRIRFSIALCPLGLSLYCTLLRCGRFFSESLFRDDRRV